MGDGSSSKAKEKIFLVKTNKSFHDPELYKNIKFKELTKEEIEILKSSLLVAINHGFEQKFNNLFKKLEGLDA